MFRFSRRSPPSLYVSRYLVRFGGRTGMNRWLSAVVAASCVRWREGEKEEAIVSRWQNTWE